MIEAQSRFELKDVGANIMEFRPDAQRRLIDMGGVVLHLNGRSVVDYKKIDKSIQGDWFPQRHDILRDPSVKSQVVVFPDNFILKNSGNKNYQQQIEALRKNEFWESIRSVNGVKIKIGALADYIDIAYSFQSAMSKSPVGTNEDYQIRTLSSIQSSSGKELSICLRSFNRVNTLLISKNVNTFTWNKNSAHSRLFIAPFVIPAALNAVS